jgi:hypothetical protein
MNRFYMAGLFTLALSINACTKPVEVEPSPPVEPTLPALPSPTKSDKEVIKDGVSKIKEGASEVGDKLDQKAGEVGDRVDDTARDVDSFMEGIKDGLKNKP